MRLIAALSGGVDSAVATARAQRAGHELLGVHLILGSGSKPETEPARRVAEQLGIDFEVWDLADAFAGGVIDYFVDEYGAGRTPNPCLRCNRTLKFGTLLDQARERGYAGVVTGHYARLERDQTGQNQLWRAADQRKDQSYVLGVLNPEQLNASVFPLGGDTKPEVRAEAAELGLPVASKADSTDICFLPTGDLSGFLSRRLTDRPGEIVDSSGAVLGEHAGHHHFTVGQRKGLLLHTPAADGKPRYVVGIDAASNRVLVGQGEDLLVRAVICHELTWTSPQPPRQSFTGQAQYRAHGAPVDARFTPQGECLRVDFDQPVPSIAPGQFLVSYAGDRVLGSGVIAETLR